jgi:hypothetical protein
MKRSYDKKRRTTDGMSAARCGQNYTITFEKPTYQYLSSGRDSLPIAEGSPSISTCGGQREPA